MSKPSEQSEAINKILTNVRWAAVLKLAAQLFSWVSTLIVIRFVTPEDYGLQSMLMSPVALMMLLSTFGFESVLVQAKKLSDEVLQTVFGGLLLINLGLFLLYYFGGAWLAGYFGDPRLELLAQVLSVIFLLVPFRVIPNALLDRALDFKLKAQVELVASVCTAVSTLVMAYLGLGVWALLLGVLINRGLNCVLLMIMRPWMMRPRFDFGSIRPMMSMGWLVVLAGLAMTLSDALMTFVAGPEIGTTMLGIYVVSLELAMLSMSKTMPILNPIIVPAFAQFQDNQQQATHYLKKFLGIVALMLFPALIGTAVIADKLVLVVLGAQWSDCVLPLAVLAVGMLFKMNNLLWRQALIAMGAAKISLNLCLIHLAVLFGMIMLLLPFGLMALIVGWIATEVIVLLCSIYLSRAVFDLSCASLFACYFPALMSALLMALGVLAFEYAALSISNWLVLPVSMILGGILYYFAVRWLFPEQLRLAHQTILGGHLLFLLPKARA